MATADNDRFGVSAEQALLGINGCPSVYVPTRSEVATLPAERVTKILEDWIWESPPAVLPTAEQIHAALAILDARPDAKQLMTIRRTCIAYVYGLTAASTGTRSGG